MGNVISLRISEKSPGARCAAAAAATEIKIDGHLFFYRFN